VYSAGKPSACYKRRFASSILHSCNVKMQICATVLNVLTYVIYMIGLYWKYQCLCDVLKKMKLFILILISFLSMH